MHVAAVEVDRDTGRVTVTRYVVVEDCGPVINPLLVEGQIHGAVAQGLGEALLEEIQEALYQRALTFRADRTADVSSHDELKQQIERGFARVYWAGTTEDEQRIQDECRATIRCIPLDQPEAPGTCFYTGKETSQMVIFARAY